MTTDQREITIPKHTIEPGFYVIRITIFMKNLGFSEYAEEYLQVIEEPMNVRIKGGSTRLLSWEEEIIMDGSLSYDPNILTGDPKDLSFKWYCTIKPGSLLAEIGRGGCFGYGANIVEDDSSIWTIEPKAFVQNTAYIITLVAENKAVPGRNATFEQVIDVKGGTIIMTNIV